MSIFFKLPYPHSLASNAPLTALLRASPRSALPSHSNTPLDHERLADGQELREWDVERPVEYEEIKQLSLGEHSVSRHGAALWAEGDGR